MTLQDFNTEVILFNTLLSFFLELPFSPTSLTIITILTILIIITIN